MAKVAPFVAASYSTPNHSSRSISQQTILDSSAPYRSQKNPTLPPWRYAPSYPDYPDDRRLLATDRPLHDKHRAARFVAGKHQTGLQDRLIAAEFERIQQSKMISSELHQEREAHEQTRQKLRDIRAMQAEQKIASGDDLGVEHAQQLLEVISELRRERAAHASTQQVLSDLQARCAAPDLELHLERNEHDRTRALLQRAQEAAQIQVAEGAAVMELIEERKAHAYTHARLCDTQTLAACARQEADRQAAYVRELLKKPRPGYQVHITDTAVADQIGHLESRVKQLEVQLESRTARCSDLECELNAVTTKLAGAEYLAREHACMSARAQALAVSAMDASAGSGRAQVHASHTSLDPPLPPRGELLGRHSAAPDGRVGQKTGELSSPIRVIYASFDAHMSQVLAQHEREKAALQATLDTERQAALSSPERASSAASTQGTQQQGELHNVPVDVALPLAATVALDLIPSVRAAVSAACGVAVRPASAAITASLAALDFPAVATGEVPGGSAMGSAGMILVGTAAGVTELAKEDALADEFLACPKTLVAWCPATAEIASSHLNAKDEHSRTKATQGGKADSNARDGYKLQDIYSASSASPSGSAASVALEQNCDAEEQGAAAQHLSRSVYKYST